MTRQLSNFWYCLGNLGIEEIEETTGITVNACDMYSQTITNNQLSNTVCISQGFLTKINKSRGRKVLAERRLRSTCLKTLTDMFEFQYLVFPQDTFAFAKDCCQLHRNSVVGHVWQPLEVFLQDDRVQMFAHCHLFQLQVRRKKVCSSFTFDLNQTITKNA